MIFILASLAGISQNEQYKIDSIINLLESDHVFEMSETEKLCKEIESLSLKIDSKAGVFYSRMVRSHLFKNEPKKAEVFLNQMEASIQKEVIPDTLKISYYLAKGFNLGVKSKFLLELSAYLKADSIVQTFKKSAKKNTLDANVKMYIMGYYTGLKKYDRAIEVGKSILPTYEDNRQSGEGMYKVLLLNLGILYSRENKLDSSRYYIQKAIKIGSFSNSDVSVEYFMLARGFASESKLDSAKLYINKYLSVCDEKFPESVNAIFAYISAGGLYSRLGEYDSTEVLLQQAIAWSKPIQYKKGLLKGYKSLLINELNKNGDTIALEYLTEYINIKDSIYNRSTKELEEEFQVKYELAKEKEKIKDLEVNKEKQRMYTWLLLAVLFGGVFLFLYLINSYKNKKRLLENKVLQEKLVSLEIEQELSKKKKELTKNQEYLRISNKKIQGLEEELSSKNETENHKNLLSSIFTIFDQSYISDKEWMDIIKIFNSIYPKIDKDINEAGVKLSQNETKILMLLKLGYSNNSMSEILNISVEGVKKAKQRFKKKTGEDVYNLLIC